ncbi:MAG TPA: type II toxin-antitoxin system death-on-curing family toxin [Pyrinomonadaceae bacterium]|jgi:death-on-curing protein|nr:type II toxin-antitoxin system death-on-curing family toxin [Pyrinomonadaceae bacterium]
MIRYLSLQEIIFLHAEIISRSGGVLGIRYRGGLESAAAQPQMSFDGKELYPTLADKAAALGHALIQNHPFLDGNKRIGQAAIEVFLVLNGYEVNASVDEQERIIFDVASGSISRLKLSDWLAARITARET